MENTRVGNDRFLAEIEAFVTDEWSKARAVSVMTAYVVGGR